MAVSTFAITSVARMLVGVTAKFNPFSSRVVFCVAECSGRQVNEPVC